MMRLLKEPLLHFLVLAAALFGLFGLVGNKDAEPAKIVVSTAQIANLRDGFIRTWQRPPTAQELEGLIEDHIRSEVYYREAMALGLDRDDIVIRRRLRQKMEFMAEDMGVAEPSDDELKQYLAAHPDKFRSEDRLTFRHVFLSARRAQTLDGDAERAGAELAGANAADGMASLRDHFLLGDAFDGMPRSEVARTFGERFAERLVAVEQGRWEGPIPSGYGLHFVFLEERMDGTLPGLDAVRGAVHRELMNTRRIEAEEKLYRTLRQRYEISIEALPAGHEVRTEATGAMR
jgi:PPIC-type PPIASE domain